MLARSPSATTPVRGIDERPNLRPKTVQLYNGLLAHHLLPTFRQRPVSDIREAQVRRWRKARLDAGVASLTVAKAYRLLKAILNTAVDDGLIRRNPCRIKGASQETSPERPALNFEQVYALANAIGPRPAWAGMAGELRAALAVSDRGDPLATLANGTLMARICRFVRKGRRAGVFVRRATVEDAPNIAWVHVRGWQEAYADLLPADFLRGLSVDQRQEQWSRRLTEPGAHKYMLVAEADESVCGFAGVCPSRDSDAAADTGELAALYIDPTAWGQGIGTYLQQYALAALSGDGFETATLWVLVGNQRARSFYERTGWRPDGHTKRETRDVVVLDEVRYRRSLGIKAEEP